MQNDVIKCCKMMSSNVAKWCHHIATSQQRGEIVFHVVNIFFSVFVFICPSGNMVWDVIFTLVHKSHAEGAVYSHHYYCLEVTQLQQSALLNLTRIVSRQFMSHMAMSMAFQYISTWFLEQPAGRVITSDWSLNGFIMIAYKKSF